MGLSAAVTCALPRRENSLRTFLVKGLKKGHIFELAIGRDPFAMRQLVRTNGHVTGAARVKRRLAERESLGRMRGAINVSTVRRVFLILIKEQMEKTTQSYDILLQNSLTENERRLGLQEIQKRRRHFQVSICRACIVLKVGGCRFCNRY